MKVIIAMLFIFLTVSKAEVITRLPTTEKVVAIT